MPACRLIEFVLGHRAWPRPLRRGSRVCLETALIPLARLAILPVCLHQCVRQTLVAYAEDLALEEPRQHATHLQHKLSDPGRNIQAATSRRKHI